MYFRAQKRSVLEFIRDESGVAQVEYALVAGLLSVSAISALFSEGDALADVFDLVAYTVDPTPPLWSEPTH